MKLLDILKLEIHAKWNGIWLSGIEGEGEFKKWYRNGHLFVHCFYKKGVRHGKYKEYRSNGQKFMFCKYRFDKLHGQYSYWDQEENLKDQCIYKRGYVIK